MALTSRRYKDEPDVVRQPQARRLRLSSASDVGSAPAIHAQLRALEDQLAMDGLGAATIDRWSARRTLAFILLTCGGFWCGLAFLVLRAVR